MNLEMYCWLHFNVLYYLIHTRWAVSFDGWSYWLSVSGSCHHYQCQLLGLVPKELYWSKKAASGLCLTLDLIKKQLGMFKTFPQCNFSLEFPELLSQTLIMLSLQECVCGKSQIMHCGIFINMPYSKKNIICMLLIVNTQEWCVCFSLGLWAKGIANREREKGKYGYGRN